MELRHQTLQQLQDVLDAIREESGGSPTGGPSEANGVTAPPTPTDAVPETVPVDMAEDEAADALTLPGADLYLDAAESSAPPRSTSRRFVHRGTDWNPTVSRRGTDRVPVSVPAGFAFDHYEIRPIETSFPYDLRATSAPRRGSTQDGVVNVMWRLWGQGVVSYRVTTVCVARGASSVVRVEVGSDRWFERALHLAEQRQAFKLVIAGPDATRLWRALEPHVTATDREAAVEIAITIAICTTVIAVVGFAAVAIVLTRAIDEGCDATSDFTAPTPNGSAQAALVFDVACREDD